MRAYEAEPRGVGGFSGIETSGTVASLSAEAL
jgi:hypothetical protein